jgi:hypothetical protein
MLNRLEYEIGWLDCHPTDYNETWEENGGRGKEYLIAAQRQGNTYHKSFLYIGITLYRMSTDPSALKRLPQHFCLQVPWLSSANDNNCVHVTAYLDP